MKNFRTTQKVKNNQMAQGIAQSKTSLQASDDSFEIHPPKDDYGPSQIS